MILVSSSVIIFGLGFSIWYFSLISKLKDFLYEKLDSLKNCLIRKLIDTILSSTFNINHPHEEKVEVHRKFIKIPYQYMGVHYVARIPFARNQRRKMLDYKLYLQKKDGDEQEITHQPGCMYLLNAEMMGGIGIRVHHIPTGRDRYFDDKSVPELN